MSLTYTNEKLTAIIHQLITGEDEIVTRLRKASMPHILLLGDEDLPKQTCEVLDEIQEAVKKDAKEKNLTVDEAVSLAHKLIQVWQDVQEVVSRKRS